MLANLLRLRPGIITLILYADSLDTRHARVLDHRRITIVRVIPDQGLAVARLDPVHDDVALVHGIAVAAAAVQLAEVGEGEAGDADCAVAVVLDDLVVGAVGAPADHVRRAGYLLDGSIRARRSAHLTLELEFSGDREGKGGKNESIDR